MILVRHSVMLIVTSLAVGGCDEAPLPAEPASFSDNVGDLTPFITEALAEQLGSGSDWSIATGNEEDIVSAIEAVDQATAYLATFGPYLRTSFEAIHGREIDIAVLTPSERIYFTESLYHTPRVAYRPVHKAVGDYYLVQFETDGQPVISVAVSALNTDVRVDAGHLALPRISGSDFIATGVPAGRRLTSSPEDAIRAVAITTGLRVGALPRLVRDHVGGYSPNRSLWRIELEGSKSFETTTDHELLALHVVYVGPDGEMYHGVDTSAPSIAYRLSRGEEGGLAMLSHSRGVGDFIPIRVR